MTGKKRSVVSRRMVADGVIRTEEITVTVPDRAVVQPDDIAEVVAGLNELLPDGREILRSQAEAAQAVIDGGAAGDRLKDARHMVKLARAAQGAIEAGDADSAVMLAVALTRMEARVTFKGAEPVFRAGAGTKRGGRKGAEASKASRRGPESLRAKILDEDNAYNGPDTARVATIAKRTGATPRYVREVLRKPEP